MEEHVTFLLTEVVDSARRWEEDEVGMAAATARLDDVVCSLVERHHGSLVKPRGEGDSYFIVFEESGAAAACAVAVQRAVTDAFHVTVRSACHVGAAELRDGDWYGPTVNRCARLRAAAHGGQSLVSAEVVADISAHASTRRSLPDGMTFRSLGYHQLKDLDEPVEVFQICAAGLIDAHPPLVTLPRSHGLSLPRASFIGRDAERGEIVAHLLDNGVVTVTGAPGAGTTRLAMEAAAAWWERTGRPVRVLLAPLDDDVAAARHGHDELLVVDGVLPTIDVEGPAVLVASAPAGLGTVVRVGPLDEFNAEHLLRDRLGDDAWLPSGVVANCDGLPLAIELLARRAGSIDAKALAERLSRDPLAVLGGDRRAEPPRHSSMRATFEAAFSALDTADQVGLINARPGDPRWVAAGWHEPDGPLPLVAQFLADAGPIS